MRSSPRTPRVGAHGLVLAAYTCSGMAGLIYQVVWTRLLTLVLGHTTAAAGTVVGAFMGGLAVGAAVGGTRAARLSRRDSLRAYIALELGVGLAAFAVPHALAALTPLLARAYADGAPGVWFPLARVAVSFVLIALPALALGATFPLAVRGVTGSDASADGAAVTGRGGVETRARADGRDAHSTGALYAANTAGAALGALAAGFVLLPALGLTRTTAVGAAAGAVAAACMALALRRSDPRADDARRAAPDTTTPAVSSRVRPAVPLAVPTAALALSGLAALVHEIAWTRVLTLVLGPTVYAFSATVALVITGAALGSAAGTWLGARVRHTGAWLSGALVAASGTAAVTAGLAGTAVPRWMAHRLAEAPDLVTAVLGEGLLLAAALLVPTAFCTGAAFPLALRLAAEGAAARRFSVLYAVNTVGAVGGSLAAGFWLVPALGLHGTLRAAAALFLLAALPVAVRAQTSVRARAGALAAMAATAALLTGLPAWRRDLLASGAYLYAPFVPKGLDLEALLTAGELLYYREGAASTVSVRRLTGTITLAVDGKTDASTGGDMLTQALIAHLPLLLHEQPRRVAVIGYGSGVSVGAALSHPVERVDVVEISPEVVDAAGAFAAYNHGPLDDPRTHLLVGDGRTHLQLGTAQYDVIISEPSNPWIAGVASLFTREFFEAMRARLAPGGLVCQWANAYNISETDLRGIAATFRRVFPHGTLWLVGGDDLVFVASDRPLGDRLANISRHWTRTQAVARLAEVAVRTPFALQSLYIGGPDELARFASGGGVLTDDHLWLEFSAPRALAGRDAGRNAALLRTLLEPDRRPALLQQAYAAAGTAEWRSRGQMLAGADAHTLAYEDFLHALTLDADDEAALDGLVRAAVLTRRGAEALASLQAVRTNRPPSVAWHVARSRLLASTGASAEALDAASAAAALDPSRPDGLEQQASLHADAGDAEALGGVVTLLQQRLPDRASTAYYAAAVALMRDEVEQAAAACAQAIARDPAYAPAYDLRGAIELRRGKADAARAAFEQSLRFDARDSTAYTNLGVLALMQGDKARAARLFGEALWLVPESGTAREGLLQALAR